MPKLIFKLHNLTITVPSGSEFLEIRRKYPEAPLKFGCTRGDCGVCAIKIAEGHHNLSSCSQQEAHTLRKKGMGENCRLACQCAINGDVTILEN